MTIISIDSEAGDIRIFDDDTYTPGSADNSRSYDLEHFSEGPRDECHSMHGIEVETPAGRKYSAILLNMSGGATGVHGHSAVSNESRLFVCCGDNVFCLSLPTLSLEWCTEVDLATCFGIHEIHEKLIVRGELSVSRLSHDGEVVWQFSGRDMFVTPDGSENFRLLSDHIEVKDWNSDVYYIDYDGNEIIVEP
jgi:hypothetical protein